MRILFAAFFLVFAAFGLTHAQQKGIDAQTKTIKEDSNKVTSRTNDVGRSFDWGKGKTKVRDRLPNPYKIPGRRDVIIEAIIETLREKRIFVDEVSSRLKEGVIVTQPFVFAKGSVITQSELSRYAILDSTNTAWTRAQYTLMIEVQSIDGIQNNVTVNAKIEGRAGNGLINEWVTLRSSGLIEDQFLAKLVEVVTGNSVEPIQDTDN